MKKFETAELEIIKFNVADVITTSDEFENPLCPNETGRV